MSQHIVRTCVAISDDVEPSTLPTIPKGTYGIATHGPDDAGDFDPVDFGPPWGVQHVGNHTLVDAAAVLGNAKRAITIKKRPWRNVIRRTLKTFAGPYLRVAVERLGFYGDEEGGAGAGGATWPVEAYLYRKGTKKAALELLEAAINEAQGKPGRNAPRTIWEAELEQMAVDFEQGGSQRPRARSAPASRP